MSGLLEKLKKLLYITRKSRSLSVISAHSIHSDDKMTSEVEKYYEFVLPLVKKAGAEILSAVDIKVEMKDDFDVVTEYDRRVEKTMVEKIKQKYPQHKFIGEEESAKSGIPELTNEATWIIDPIDGTANFVRGFPITCISIGLVINKEPVLGIIFNPFLNELYMAIKGKGSFLNGKQIFTNKCKDIGRSVLNCELSLGRNEHLRELYIARFKYLIATVQGIRSYGSCALGMCYVASGTTEGYQGDVKPWDACAGAIIVTEAGGYLCSTNGCQAMGLCYVARGVSDAYQCDGLFPWDCVAGALLIKEAGGHLCSSDGKEFDLMNPNFIAAASKTLAEQYVEVLQKADAELAR